MIKIKNVFVVPFSAKFRKKKSVHSLGCSILMTQGTE